MNYAQMLKNLREDKDLYQKDIAKIIQTSQSYYAQYENGKRPLPVEHLITLAKFYNVSADYILCLTNDPTPHWTVKNDNSNNNNKTVNIEQNGNSNKIGNINL